MLLQLKPHNTNVYKTGGILIADPSPYYWLSELQRMELPVHHLKVYAIPSIKANELYGCLVITDTNLTKIDLGKNNRLQVVEDKLFIPENTVLFPQLTPDDWERLFAQHPCFLHPQLGLVELEEEVDWSKLINLPQKIEINITKPAGTVYLPSSIKSYKLEIPQDSWIENISQFESEKEMLDNLPFDMKKILNGNQKEIDKYMAFMDKYPELALKYAIPVDLMGSSRGKEWAKFHFKDNSWFNKLLDKLFSNTNFGKSSGSSSNSNTSTALGKINVLSSILVFVLVVLGIGLLINFFSNTHVSSNTNSTSVPQNSFIGFLTWLFMFAGFIFAAYIILRLATGNRKKHVLRTTGNSGTTSSSPTNNVIPSAINWETFTINQNQSNQNPISFGTAGMSVLSKVICAVLLSICLVYLFYPQVNTFGFNWVTIFLLCLFARILYLLLHTNKTFLNSKENEPQDFQHKLFSVCIIIYMFKLAFILYSFTYLPFSSALISLVWFVVSGLIIGLLVVGFSEESSRSGGNVYLDSDRLNTLSSRYEKLAQQYIKKNDYSRAAYIYLKLLKSPNKAAETLADGKQYQNAAYVYLKHCQNKNKAAECFENGKLYTAAIDLYKELNQDEKVGDLYMLMKERKNAFEYYNKIIDKFKDNNQYVKASLIYRNKMQDYLSAQSLLLNGWENNKDGINCLNNYFANINDMQLLEKEIEHIYQTKTTNANQNNFLQVIKHEYNKDEKLHEVTQNIAYQIVAEQIKSNRSSIQELKHFTKKDKNFLKDIMKFKLFGS